MTTVNNFMRIFFRVWFLWKILKYMLGVPPWSGMFLALFNMLPSWCCYLYERNVLFNAKIHFLSYKQQWDQHWSKEIKTSSKVKSSDAKSRKSVGGLAVFLLKLTSPWKRSILGLPNFRSLGFPLSLSPLSLTLSNVWRKTKTFSERENHVNLVTHYRPEKLFRVNFFSPSLWSFQNGEEMEGLKNQSAYCM